MGRGRSKVNKTGGSAGGVTVRASVSTAPTVKTVNQQAVDDWMEENNPGDFLTSAPEKITVNGVEFTWFAEHQRIGSKGEKFYNNSYQASVQAANGEWPVIETIVKAKTVKHVTTFSFVKGMFGTGLR